MPLPRFVDQYTLRARLLPALIAGASAFCAFFALAPWDRMGLPQLAAALASSILLAALADIARRRGKKLEPRLLKKWGGKPTTMMLRHRDDALDADTTKSHHAFLAFKLGLVAPTAKDERDRPDDCDVFYERCGDWLREHTRDTEKFRILFDENVTYGFRRNQLGLKMPALVIDGIVVVGCTIYLLFFGSSFGATTTEKVLPILVFAVLHAAYILAFVTERSVRDAARQYARQLLLCCQVLGDMGRAPPKKKASKAKAA
jgi:hypothetical protein